MASTVDEVAEELKSALIEYVEAAYHIGDPALLAQRRALLEELGVVHQAPFLESTPRYKTGAKFRDLPGIDVAALKALETLAEPTPKGARLFYDPPYTHQAQAVATVAIDQRSAIIMTGTGSGKTESFLMPVVSRLAAEATAHPDVFREQSAVRSLILYPMNALVNDQLGRLRAILGDPRLVSLFNGWAGRPPRFARYTSRTPYAGVRDKEKDQRKLKPFNDFYVDLIEKARSADEEENQAAQALMEALKGRGKWPAKPDIERWFKGKRTWQDASGNFQRAVTLPDDSELLTRHESQVAAPDLLVTNYSMLEYMLMRPVERTIFDQTRLWLQKNQKEKFLLILDESHLYRGAAGAEVGLLIRRLRDRLGISVERMQIICATASFDQKSNAPEFASKLTGVPANSIVGIDGQKLERPNPAIGGAEDASVLSFLDMSDEGFYSEKPQDRARSVEPFLKFRGEKLDRDGVEPALLRALKDYPPLSLLVNHTMGQARPVDELGLYIFPKSDKRTADVALTNLAALAANARTKADDPSLLPCRVHMFFRGLRGLWVCMDPNCTAIDPSLRGAAGKLYAQPRELCDCFARVYEFYTCRVCGTAYARGYTDNPEAPQTVWSEPGAPLKMSAGELAELGPLDIMLTEPGSPELGEPADLDLLTGRINPEVHGSRMRRVYLSPDRAAAAVTDDDEGDTYIAKAGAFKKCGLCERKTYQERSPVQDHETKGDQPFQVLLGKQLQVQPPGPQRATQFAPLRGRKVLAFSDSRQVAARLAPNLQLYAARDSLRPLMVRGWLRLAQLPKLRLQLDDIYTAVLLAAWELDVRLRPELAQHETFSDYPIVGAKVKNQGILDDDEALKELCTELRASDPPPQTLMADVVSVLRDRALGLEALGFASIVERADKRATIERLPDVPGVATDAATKVQLARAWLRRWNHSGFWLAPKMGAQFYLVHPDSKVRVKARSDAFQDFLSWLPTPAARQTFKTKWLPELLSLFTERMEPRKHRLIGRYLSLEFGGSWVRCADCKSVHRQVGNIQKCQDCGHETVKPMDPDADEVFAKRKGYYRRAIKEALGPTPKTPLSLIAAEHTAQLNAASADSIFSKSEENELLFQDVELPPASGKSAPMAIDVLSSTTTMEVGIDIGQLSGVALRNMPPGRANYQQRAGRAGRRGNAIATVVAFSGSDTHDEHYFSQPQAMISGPVVDPTLTLNNPDIARRHVRAFLLQTYHQDKIPFVTAGAGTGNLFSVLGNVDDFLKPNSVLSRDGFETWMKANEGSLDERVRGWIPGELAAADRDTLLKEMVADTMKAIDLALHERTTQAPQERVTIDPPEAPETQPETDEEKPPVATANRALLDTLLYKGVLPRYAFPTDVATFHVFNLEKSTRFRPEMDFAPGQSRNVALSQYAPGKLIWIAGKCYTSGAIYSPFESDRRQQWDDRRLYLECTSCGYAFTKLLNESIDKSQTLDCDACKGPGTLGPARYWMRPVGFAHPVDQPPVISPDELPLTSYATRARLTLKSPDDKGWTPVTDRIRYVTARTHLLVSNTGPASKGYSYCTACGRIEATSAKTGSLNRLHPKPYPDEKKPNCPGYTSEGIVLGTDFITDVALFSLRLNDPIRLSAGETITQTALRTLAEALARAACDLLEIEPGEVQAEYRPALSQEGKQGYETEIFLYDTLPGGAGFSQAAAQAGRTIFDLALKRMTACPEGTKCDLSCYRCLRTFRNRIDHSALDRHTGRALLNFLLNGDSSGFDERRLRAASRLLVDDLERQLPAGWAVNNASLKTADLPADCVAPIEVVDALERRHLVIVRSPLEDLNSKEPLETKGTPWASIQEVSELEVRKNLPAATNRVRRDIAALG